MFYDLDGPEKVRGSAGVMKTLCKKSDPKPQHVQPNVLAIMRECVQVSTPHTSTLSNCPPRRGPTKDGRHQPDQQEPFDKRAFDFTVRATIFICHLKLVSKLNITFHVATFDIRTINWAAEALVMISAAPRRRSNMKELWL